LTTTGPPGSAARKFASSVALKLALVVPAVVSQRGVPTSLGIGPPMKSMFQMRDWSAAPPVGSFTWAWNTKPRDQSAHTIVTPACSR